MNMRNYRIRNNETFSIPKRTNSLDNQKRAYEAVKTIFGEYEAKKSLRNYHLNTNSYGI